MNIGQLEWDAIIRDTQFGAQINRIESRLNQFARNVERDGDSIERLFQRASAAAAGFFSIQAAQGFVQQIIAVRGQFEQLEIAFSTILGSKQKADDLMKQIVEFAGTTPFGLKDTSNAAKQLLAYGSAANDVIKELRMLGDVAAGTSAPINDIVYLYGTLRTQGRAYLMDIRQFAGRGIPIYRELSKVLGVAEGKVNDLVSAGKVGFKEVQQAFVNMTAAGSTFGGLMEAQSKSITGQVERLKDGFDVMLNNIGKANQGLISDGIAGLSELVENYEKIMSALEALIIVYGAYRAALILTAALERLAVLQRAGVTASFALQYANLVLLAKAQSAYNTVLAASPVLAYTALIAALGAAIYSLTQTVNAAEEAEDALNKSREAGQKSADDESRAIENQIGVLRSSVSTAEQKNTAYQKLIELTKGAVSSYSQEEIAAGKAADAIAKYVGNIKNAIEAREAFAEYNRLAAELDELNLKGVDALSWSQKLGQSLKNTFAPTSQGLTGAEWWEGLFNGKAANERIVNQVKDAKKTAQEEIKKQFKGIWDELVTGVPQNQNNGQTKVTSRTVDVIEAEIKALKEKQSAEATNSAEYQKYQRQIIALEKELTAITGKQTKQTAQAIERRKDFLLDLAKLEDEINRKSLDQIEEKKQAERDRFEDYRRRAKEAGLGEGVMLRIDKAQGKAFNDIDYRSDTESLEKQFDNQLKIQQGYLDASEKGYEDYYSKINDVQDDFESKLQSQIGSLMTKKLDGTINSSEEERLKKLVEIQSQYGETIQQIQDQIYQRAIEASRTSAQQIERIEKEYRENIKALGENASKEELDRLKRERDQKVSAETSANLEITTGWNAMYRVLDRLGKQAVREYIRKVQERVEAERKAGTLTQEEYLEWQNKLLEANDRLATRDPFSALSSSIKKYIKLLKDSNAEEADKVALLNQIAGQASATFSDMNAIVGSLAEGFETIGIGGEGLQETLTKVQNVLGGLSELGQGIASGNAASVITGAIKTLTSVIDLFNTKDKRLQKQIEGYSKALKALEVQYDALQRKIDDSVGKSYYDDSEAAINNLQEQIKNLTAARDAESNKKKKDKEAIEGYNDAIRSAQYAIEDIQKAISENLLQTNFKQLSDNLANALLTAFEAGENGIEAMNKSFDQFIKNALANSLKLKLIEPLMKKMTEELTSYMMKNDDSLVGFKFDGWREQLDKAGGDFSKALEEAYKGLGLKPEGDPSKSSSLAGIIGQSLTEDTANKWMGIQLNIYTITKNHFAESQLQSRMIQTLINIATKNLDAALGTQRNTAAAVDRLDVAVGHLATLVSNTKPQYDLARNKGLG